SARRVVLLGRVRGRARRRVSHRHHVSVIPGCDASFVKTDVGFDYSELVNELRCHTTDWLWSRRVELVREQRRRHVEELAVTTVLDERGGIDDTIAGADGVSVRSMRETVETARALQSLPRVAAAAHEGTISPEQLNPLAQLADAESDAEWAQRGRSC